MGWNKISEHEFTYNEGSLNFTLRGGAFHDNNGDGVPEGVSFENGRPVFMGIKNLRDFHFDVPRGYLVVNGNEYKLVDLDKNPENGEELQLFRENVGFPQGDDRTNPKAYSKVDEHQFTYNEGSLHYTLTGGAFNDSNGDNIPDGVQIIGPKPCFGADGTVFDTSVENFHFKVPSGALMVNGELYKLAELDDNPDNGYELVIPEKADKIGWTPIDKPLKGFAFKRPSDNNPINFGSFKLFGAGLVDKNGDGNPDGVEVPTVILGEEIDGVRVTRIGITGLSGEVKLNHPQYSLGVYDDDNYGIEIVKHGGDLYQTIYSNISPGATVVVSTGTEVINTVGNGTVNVLASKSFVMNGHTVEVNGDKYLTIKLNGDKISLVNEEVLGWQQRGNKFEFVGRPANDPSQKIKFNISGNNLRQEDLKISVLRKVPGLGIRAGIDGLSGEVKLNGKSLGISGDSSYGVHFTPIIDPNITPENLAQVQSLELLNVSPGSTINSVGNWIILDGDGEYHFADGDYLVATKPAHSVDDLQKVTVSNGGKGADINVDKGDIVPTDGVSIVNGAVEILDSGENGDSGVGNIVFEILETAFENVIGFLEDLTGESDDAVDLASVDTTDAETLDINDDTTVNMNAVAMNDFEIPPAPVVSDNSYELLTEPTAQEQLFDELLPYSNDLNELIKKDAAASYDFDEQQPPLMSYVKYQAPTSSQSQSVNPEEALEKWQAR